MISRRQIAHRYDDGVNVLRKNVFDPPLAFRRQVNSNDPAIIALAFAARPTVLHEVVDNERHIPAGLQQLPCEFMLAKRTEVIERLEGAELADR